MRKKPIKIVQDFLRLKNWDGLIIPRTDEYLNENISPYAERLKWVSNFSGSFGITIILQKTAAIFTDGRYTVQIKSEVDKKLFSIFHIKNFEEWISKNISQKSIIALDPKVFSQYSIDNLNKIIVKKKISLHYVSQNPIDLLWKDQPKRPKSKAFLHDDIYAGKNSKDKINKIQKKIKKIKCNYFLITALDSIAWILNLRGSDIDYTPLNLGILLMPKEGKPQLYINLSKITKSVNKKLSSIVNFINSKEIEKSFNSIPKDSIIGLDKKLTPCWYVCLFNKKNLKVKYIEDPCILDKSIKNQKELQGAKKANIRDSISIIKFLYSLKKLKIIKKIDEIKASNKLYKLRKNNHLFHSLSFCTISAFGEHAALPHYRVTEKSNKNFLKNGIYLFDSGAQYYDGTTDLTRTIVLGVPNSEQKDKFTRVLKGHIALAKIKFKRKTRGSEIDYIARQSLQEVNCDYDHGTGHGIGCFLNVHEGPQRIFKSLDKKDAYLEPGMILSNEPGFYKEGAYGIRIENLIIVKEDKENKLCFETISHVPIDIDLIDRSLLTYEEKKWLNNYHKKVYDNVAQKMNSKELKWLKKVTLPI